MLELIGADYVIDHVVSEHNLRHEQRMFRSYVSDLLMILAEGKKAVINYHYSELIERPKNEKERTADEIVLDVMTRAGLKGSTTDECTGPSSDSIA